MAEVRVPTKIATGRRSLTILVASLGGEISEVDNLIATSTDAKELSSTVYEFTELLQRFEKLLEELAVNVEDWDVKTKEQRETKSAIEDEATKWQENLENGFTKLRKLKKTLRRTGAECIENDNSQSVDTITKILKAQNETQDATQLLLGKLVDNKVQQKISVKLPNLELKVFDGNMLSYQEFYDLFVATIHENDALSPVQKFGYLKKYLSGKPLELINGLKVCDNNYTVALEMINTRYGNKQAAIEAHYTAMMHIPPCSTNTESLRTYVNRMEVHLRSLEALGEDVEQNIFVTIMLSKLPREEKLLLELRKDDSEWTIPMLRNALNKLLNAKERADGPMHTTKPPAEASAKRSIPTGHALLTSAHYAKCVYCGEGHYSDECSRYKSLDERKAQLKSKCFICLKSGHGAKSCTSSRTCYHCKRKSHHRSLCPQKFKQMNEKPDGNGKRVDHKSDYTLNAMAKEYNPISDLAMVSQAQKHNVLLQTALVDATNVENTRTHTVRILFDTGSTRSYITENASKALNLQHDGSDTISLATFGATQRSVKDYPAVKLLINQKNGESAEIQANVVDSISCPLQKVPLTADKHASLQKICLAEPLCDTLESMPIDILIGADQYFQFIGTERLEYPDGLILIDSTLGFVRAGKVNAKGDHTLICHEAFSLVAGETCDPKEFNLERFWSLENVGISETELKTEDDTALDAFKDSVRYVNGRYFVSWPWKDESPNMPENLQLAGGRLRSLLKRLPNNVLLTYHDTIQQQLTSGVIEVVDTSKEPEGVVHYIPHHCVIKSTSESTKLRIVYDASAKSNQRSQSLNESMYRGPVMLPDLCGILLRFRMSPVAISSDVEKAFLQIGLNQPDRECTRFLWVADPTKPATGENLITYRFCRIPFGVVSSPFLLSATIQHHLSETKPTSADEITRNIYVDNVIGGAEDTKAAQHYYEEQKQTFAEASMNLRQWASNDSDFISSLPENDQVKGNRTKVLGMGWDTDDDVIWVPSPRPASTIQTKRQLLQCISAVFDPMGMVSPITVEAKIIMQELWKRKFGWDDELPEDVCKECQKLFDSLSSIGDIQLPRFVGTRNEDGSIPKYELHVFTDASAKAYGAAAYLRTTCGDNVSVDLLFSKSRIAPTKPTSIPRLELFAVVLGTKLVKFIREQVPFDFTETHIWTDSKCALAWVTAKSERPQFIERRIKTIHSVNNVKFGHVAGKENPADVVSRGTNTTSLQQNALWWEGPTWLKSNVYPESVYPEMKHVEVLEEDDPPTESVFVTNESTAMHKCEKFSSFAKLVRVNAWILRFVKKVKREKSESDQNLTAEELANSRLNLIRSHQIEQFGNEIKAINRGKNNQLVNNLGLFLDNGLIRCKGRLEYAHLPYESKYPLLLAYGSSFTELIIMEQHISLKHCGVSQTLAELRRYYWVPKGRSMVKRVINKCLLCKRHQGKPFATPPFAPLPEERLTPGNVFESVGLDYFGPLFVKTETEPKKVWVCLYTCLTTRAIHLELMHDMTAEQFLMGFRRFISRRGTPKYILSDNAKQFKLSKNVLDLLWSESVQHDDVMEFVAGKGIRWKFITELAPWMGGVYERLVGIVKKSLRKSIGKSQLSSTQLDTLLIEIEAIVNSRPLLYVGEEFTLEHVLTPANFLTGKGSLGQPNFVISDNDPDFAMDRNSAQQLSTLWKRQLTCLDNFWKIWSSEYLQTLLWPCTNQLMNNNVPSVGCIVLVKELNTPRSCWKLAQVTSLHPSSDGIVRSLTLRLPSGKSMKRPVSHCYPLECSLDVMPQVEGNDAPDEPHPVRPRRNAAAAAALRNQDLIEDGQV